MPDRGMCDRCGKPSVMFRGSWVCTNCGAERAHDPDHDQGPKRKPDGYWRRGGSRGPDRSSR